MTMPSSLEMLLRNAEAREKRYEWIAAATSYEEAAEKARDTGELFKAAGFQERIGYCFYRGAFQAKTRDEFVEKMSLAIGTYEKGERAYKQMGGRSAWASRCAANASLCRHWLAVASTEKNELMADWFRKQEQALEGFWSIGEKLEFGETYGLISDVFDRFNDCRLNDEVWRIGLQKGRLWGEEAVAVLSELEAEAPLGRAYFSLSICLLRSIENIIQDPDELRSTWGLVREYLHRGLELADRVGDVHTKGKTSNELGYHSPSQEERLKYRDMAMECAEETRDLFLRITATASQVSRRSFDLPGLEDPDEITRSLEEYRDYASRLEPLSPIISFYGHRTGSAQLFPPWSHVYYYYLRGNYEADLEKKKEFLDRAIDIGTKSLQWTKEYWGDLTPTGILGRAFSARAKLEPNPAIKGSMLQNALTYLAEPRRLVPSRYYLQASLCYEWGDVKAELAELTPNSKEKTGALEEAVASYAKGLEFDGLQERVELREYQPSIMAPRYPQHARLLTRLYSLTKDPRHLKKAVEVLQKGTDLATRSGLVTRVAECLWELGKVQDDLGDFSKAAGSFRHASEKYTEGAERIPLLRDFYQDIAVYMLAWSEIEEAREFHSHIRYEEAANHFDRAAELLNNTGQWSHFSVNYSAWARLEDAEALSRNEKTEEARDAFQLAADSFADAKSSILSVSMRTKTKEERENAETLANASDLRREYCLCRAVLEEARILSGQGDLASSSKRYDSAAERFERLAAKEEQESERNELRPIVSLCRAWSKMVQAEQRSSPSLYREASELFEQAVGHAVDQRTSALAQANSLMCKALEAGTGYEATKDAELFSAAKKYLDGATTQYLRAGYRTMSEYSRATSRLLDAYLYMYRAQVEADPTKKAQSYQMAETMLQTSAGSYVKARLPAKAEEVQRVLEIVREDREIAISLSGVLKAPAIASATTGFLAPSQSHEQAVGIERFDESEVLANLLPGQKEIEVGQNVSLEIELVNAGRGAAQLVKVEGLIPAGFELVEKPSVYRVEDSFLDMKGKSLNPLKTEEVRILVKAVAKGTHQLKPRVLYLDNSGKYKSYEPEPVTIIVKELGISGWLKGPRT